MTKKSNLKNNTEFKMTKEGSLGLLAYGDIGLREWRKFKNQENEIEDKHEEK